MPASLTDKNVTFGSLTQVGNITVISDTGLGFNPPLRKFDLGSLTKIGHLDMQVKALRQFVAANVVDADSIYVANHEELVSVEFPALRRVHSYVSRTTQGSFSARDMAVYIFNNDKLTSFKANQLTDTFTGSVIRDPAWSTGAFMEDGDRWGGNTFSGISVEMRALQNVGGAYWGVDDVTSLKNVTGFFNYNGRNFTARELERVDGHLTLGSREMRYFDVPRLTTVDGQIFFFTLPPWGYGLGNLTTLNFPSLTSVQGITPPQSVIVFNAPALLNVTGPGNGIDIEAPNVTDVYLTALASANRVAVKKDNFNSHPTARVHIPCIRAVYQSVVQFSSNCSAARCDINQFITPAGCDFGTPSGGGGGGSAAPSSSSPKLSDAETAGIAVGCVAAAALVLFITFCVSRRRRADDKLRAQLGITPTGVAPARHQSPAPAPQIIVVQQQPLA